MKTVKRNAVIVTVLLFACAAVYLNWSYNREVEDASEAGSAERMQVSGGEEGEVIAGTVSESAEDGDSAGLFYESAGAVSEDETQSGSGFDEYFAAVRLERQQARDEAAAALETIASAQGAAQETVDEALGAMTQMAQWAVREAELENLIRAKGFLDCVVYLSEEGATVTVAAQEGLSEASVARITDIILSGTDFSAEDLNVVEIK